MKVQLGYTYDSAEIISRLILFFSKGHKSHVLVVFTLNENEWKWFMERFGYRLPVDFKIEPDHDGFYRIYFESIWKVDRVTHKTGVRGPYPIENLLEWKDKKKQTRELDLQDVKGLTETEKRETIARCMNYVGLLEYAPLQLLWNAQTLVRGIARPFRKRTRRYVTCVEFAVIVLPGRYGTEYLDLHYLTAEEYVPSSNRCTGLGLYEMVEDANRIISIGGGEPK